MKNHEYTVEVTRTEVRTVSEGVLQAERAFRAAQAERKAGKPCRSANGVYLNGWYNPELPRYYVTEAAEHLV